MRLRPILVSALLLLAALAVGLYSLRGTALAGSGWVAKRVCSGVFVAHRDIDSLVEASLPLPVPIPIPAQVDRERFRVTAFFANYFAPSTAIYRPGLGCTLAGPDRDGSPIDAAEVSFDRVARLPLPSAPENQALEAAVARAFDKVRPEEPEGLGTRAVVVVHHGELAAEHYAPSFSATTPLPGWSMTKSVTGTLVGLLADAGRIDIRAPVGLAEWSAEGDPRRAITWDQLLRMSSGLAFEEDYERPYSNAIQMLFGAKRFSRGRYAATQPLAHPPDSHWSYSSGTTNILQYALLTRVFGGDLAAYLRFPHDALFTPLGMSSGVLEPDESGVFVGSSHMFATARDWARFGLLYLDAGRVGSRQVLSSKWVAYSATPTPTNASGIYGAQWWLNADPDNGERRMPSLDANILIASGFEGQSIVVVPNHDLVVVRLGLDRGAQLDIERLVADVVGALPQDTAAR